MPKYNRKENKPPLVLLYAAMLIVFSVMCVLAYIYITAPLHSPVAAGSSLSPSPTAAAAEPVKTIAVTTEAIASAAETEEESTAEITEETAAEEITVELTSEETSAFITEAAIVYDDYSKSFFSNTLFIGDSIFTGLNGYGYISGSNVFAEKGLDAASVLLVYVNGQGVLSASKGFERAVIMLGTNSIKANAQTNADNTKTLIKKLKEENSDMEIVVLTVPPCASQNSYGITMKMINNYNAALTEAANDEDFILIDLCSDFKNGDGYIKSEYVQPDGLHLTQKGYKELLAMVEYELE